jgi:hypothetical protein
MLKTLSSTAVTCLNESRNCYDYPELGLLDYLQMGLAFVQYWRLFEHLEAYARLVSLLRTWW